VARKLRSLAPDLAARVRGGLLFSGLGRGERLYGVPNHDSDAFARRVGDVSLSGCFCNGEIGPVAGRTFLHGYTSVYTVFSELAR
jgi:small ligand-binding sensory domain FIST